MQKRLTTEQKQEIVKLCKAGVSFASIASYVGCSIGTALRTILILYLQHLSLLSIRANRPQLDVLPGKICEMGLRIEENVKL